MLTIVVALIVLIGGSSIYRLTALRSKYPSGFECSLRVLSGKLPGLSKRWKHGYGVVSPASLTWRPRTPPFRAIELAMVTLNSQARRVQKLEGFWINSMCLVFRLSADGFELELAVLPAAVERLTEGIAKNPQSGR